MNFSELVTPNGLFCDGDWIEKKDQDTNGNVRLIQLADIGVCFFKNKSSKFVTERKAQELNCTYLQKGDILIARLPEPLGRACIFPFDGKYITAVDIAIVRIDRHDVNPKYMMYMLNSPGFRSEIKQYESGTTRKRISRKNLDKIQFDIPTFSEQNRVVARIEELFSQLDASVNELKTAKERLKVYRQAVLKEAFDICSERIALSSVCRYITDGDHMPPPKAQSGIPFIMISNVNQNKIDWTNTAYVGRAYYDNLDEKRRPQNGDVLYTVTGSFGIPILVDFNEEFCFQRHIALLRPDNSITQKYLFYAMQDSSVYSQASKMATGTAQKTVGLSVLRKMTIPYVESINIQQEIVSKIETQLSICDNIKKAVDTSLQQAEALRQSILKKAFEGKLV